MFKKKIVNVNFGVGVQRDIVWNKNMFKQTFCIAGNAWSYIVAAGRRRLCYKRKRKRFDSINLADLYIYIPHAVTADISKDTWSLKKISVQ